MEEESLVTYSCGVPLYESESTLVYNHFCRLPDLELLAPWVLQLDEKIIGLVNFLKLD